MIRPPAVAGSWYPANPSRLAAAIDGYLAGSAACGLTRVRALLAPHAGFMFSGPTAGAAFRVAASHRYDAIIVVGPSHYLEFHGVAGSPDTAFATPLGTLDVAGADVAALVDARCGITTRRDAHEREHAIEMELPFIARLFPTTPLVPLVMGDQRRDTVDALAAALAHTFAGRDVLLVASSDLSHFFDADAAEALDARVAAHVGAFDADGLMCELERYEERDRGRYVMCGGGAAVAVMRAARHLGAADSRVLARTHSGHISGDLQRVVGYMGAAFGTGGEP